MQQIVYLNDFYVIVIVTWQEITHTMICLLRNVFVDDGIFTE